MTNSKLLKVTSIFRRPWLRVIIKFRWFKELLFIASFGIVGSIVLIATHAQTPPSLSLRTNHNQATVTTIQSSIIANFTSSGQQITKFDLANKGIDAHDGDLAFFNGTYYLYGTSYGCGYQLSTKGTPFCGFKSYSSPDLLHWTDNGYLFNATTSAWQAACSAPRYGCYRPHVLHNSSTNKYVLWINSYDRASGFHVFTASTPQGPFIEQAEPIIATMGKPGAYVTGDFDLFQDDTGSAYLNYTDINFPTPVGQNSHILKIQKLDNTYTHGIGLAIDTGASGSEAPSLFKRGSTYYMVYGPGCAYCGHASSLYKTAQAVLGNWSAPKLLNPTSCGGQPSFVAKIPTTSGDPAYVFGSDLWDATNGQPLVRNQALANYFWTPLNFAADGAIRPFTCSPTVNIPLAETTTYRSILPANLDSTNGPGDFRSFCDVSNNWSRAQSFTATRTGVLTTISLNTFQKDNPNGAVGLHIYVAGANHAPVGKVLYNGVVPPSYISWSPTTFVASPNIAVTKGLEYVIVLEANNTDGCYGWEFNDSNTYGTGAESYRSGHGNWIQEPGRDLKFQTNIN